MSVSVAPAGWTVRPIPSPSHGIPVERYDLTLLWPVLLEAVEDASSRRSEVSATERLDEWVQAVVSASRDERCPDGRWKEQSSYPRGSPDEELEYSEFVYFHPFVRNFLYVSRDDVRAASRRGIQDPPNRNLRVLERVDLRRGAIEVDFELQDHTTWVPSSYPPVTVRLRIRHVELYLFDTGVALDAGVALLALKMDRDESQSGPTEKLVGERFTLETVLKLQDVIRRAYAPYWEQTTWGQHQAGHCPLEVRLYTPDGQLAASSLFGTYKIDGDTDDDRANRDAVQEHLRRVRKEREPHAVGLWTTLLQPLRARPLQPEYQAGECNLYFRQIEDDRLGLLSYLAVPDPRRITAGDWLRLAMVDDPGRSDCFPAFMDEQRAKDFFYDRFWSADGAPPAQDWHTTRWLCCGYGFTAVGRAGDERFYANDKSGARAHFRQHYFKLGVIAHFHRASLLAFKSALSEAVEELRHDRPREESYGQLQDRLSEIERELLVFRNMYWFTEVSNQIQCQELFDLWSKHLRTRALFDQVFEEAREAAQVIVDRNERKQAEESENVSQQSAALTAVATAFLVLQPLLYLYDASPWYVKAGGSVLASLAALILILGFWKPSIRWQEQLRRWRWWAVAVLAVAVLFPVAERLWHADSGGPADGSARAPAVWKWVWDWYDGGGKVDASTPAPAVKQAPSTSGRDLSPPSSVPARTTVPSRERPPASSLPKEPSS